MLALAAATLQILLGLAQVGFTVRGTRVRPGPIGIGSGILLLGALGALIALLLRDLDPAITLICATSIAQVSLWIGLRHLRAVARIHRLAAEIARARGAAKSELVQSLLAHVPSVGDLYETGALRLRLSAAAALAEAAEFAAAEQLLAKLELVRLGESDCVAAASTRTVCRLYAGDPEGAARELDSIPKTQGPETERILAVTRALVTVLRGDIAGALALLGPEPDDERLLATALGRARATVRAHAFAARDELDQARATLRSLRRAHGDAALDRIVLLQGPASSLAAAMRAERDAPYR